MKNRILFAIFTFALASCSSYDEMQTNAGNNGTRMDSANTDTNSNYATDTYNNTESVYWSVIDGIRVQGKLDSFPYTKIVYVDTLIGGKEYRQMKKVNCIVAGAIEGNDTIYSFDYARGYELRTLQSSKKVLIVTNKNGTFVMD